MSKSEVTLTPGDKGWARVDVTAFSGNLAAKHTFFASVGGVAPPGFQRSQEVSILDANLHAAIRAALERAERHAYHTAADRRVNRIGCWTTRDKGPDRVGSRGKFNALDSQ